MAKPTNNPTHLPVVFTRHAYMRREHVLGAPQAEEGDSLMIVIGKGEEKKIVRTVAMDLIAQETAIRADEANNKDRIESIRAEAKEDAEREKRQREEAAKPQKLKQAA